MRGRKEEERVEVVEGEEQEGEERDVGRRKEEGAGRMGQGGEVEAGGGTGGAG